ncbi:uncharacterized protein [Diadema setosum]|uniref:uncharacterized protein n=1 Tax=Diadema setosum TaxID=31175 RepID=UPI003B3A1BF5
MKQKNVRSPESPFLPQKKLTDSPQLKFKRPEETEEWLLSREKTDYTYSRSASYSSSVSHAAPLRRLANSYETPIMSRNGQEEGELLPQTPYSAAPGHRYATRSASRRRSSRVIGQQEGGYDNTPVRGQRAAQRTRKITKTMAQVLSRSSGLIEENGAEYETSADNRSSVQTRQSGLLAEMNQKNRSLSNIYGLDRNESDISDSESLSGLASQGSSTTTITTITTTTTTTTTWLQQQGEFYRQQPGVLPFLMTCLITTLTIIETIVTTVVRVTSTSVSSAASLLGSAVSRLGHLIGDSLRLFVLYLSLLLTKLVSSCRSFWYGPWLYSFCRAPVTTLMHGKQYAGGGDRGGEGGGGGGGGRMHTSSTYTETMTTTIIEEEKRRKRGGGIPLCCFCLPLLLFLMLLSAATTGHYFFIPLLARNESNETVAESPLQTINQQFILLKDRAGYWFTPSPPSPPHPGDSQSGAGFIGGIGAEGCIKCLKQDQLLGWINGAVRNELGELRTQLHSQNQQIQLLQQVHTQQASEILALQTQLADSLAASGDQPPNKATLILINSMESKITELKGDMRTLQLKVDSEGDVRSSSPTVVSLRQEFSTLSEGLVGLRGSLQRLHTKLASDVHQAQRADRQQRGDIGLLSANMLTITQKIAEVEGLELTLIQLKREMDTLVKTDGQHTTQFGTIVASINSVESSLTAIRSEMRDLEFNVSETNAAHSSSSSHMSALLADMSQLRQDLTEMKMKHVGFEGSVESLVAKHAGLMTSAGSMESDLAELRVAVNQLISGDVSGIVERLGQLQTRLTGLEKESSQLQVGLNTLQTRTIVTQSDAGSDSQLDSHALSGLQDSVNKLNSQFASLQTEIATIKLKVTELKASDSLTTQTIDSHSLKLVALGRSVGALERSLNGSVVMLPGADGAPQSLISVVDMRTLKEEMDNIHIALNKLKNEMASETSSGISILTGEVNSLENKVVLLRERLDQAKLETSLTSLSDGLSDVRRSQNSLADDVATLQLNTGLLQKQTSRTNGEAIQLSVLETSLNDLSSSMQRMALGSEGVDATTGCSSKQNLDWIKGDINALRETLASINAILFAKDSGETSQSTFLASIQERVTKLDSDLLDLKMSSGSCGKDVEASIATLQGQVDALVLDFGHLKTAQEENSAGLAAAGLVGTGLGAAGLGAAAGAAYREDLSELKANVSELQQQYAHLEVDVITCCKNKTGVGMFPWWFNSGSQSGAAASASGQGSLDEERVKSIVLGALDMYNADKTGMVDYALESAGGSVLNTRCSETYSLKTALFSIFGIPIWYQSNSPRTVIQPDVHPGNCWAFRGTQGYVVIQLANVIKPTAFSMEHIPKTLDPTGSIDSAPKNFSVWGLRDEYDQEGFLFGSYVYDQNGSPLQFFPVQVPSPKPIPLVELKIESNHGKMEYTCLYRFRVHGVLHR